MADTSRRRVILPTRDHHPYFTSPYKHQIIRQTRYIESIRSDQLRLMFTYLHTYRSTCLYSGELTEIPVTLDGDCSTRSLALDPPHLFELLNVARSGGSAPEPCERRHLV